MDYRCNAVVSSVLISSDLNHVYRVQINIEGNEQADAKGMRLELLFSMGHVRLFFLLGVAKALL